MKILIEEWKPIVDYEESYEVSNKGRVRSLNRKVLCKNGVIKNLKGKYILVQKFPNGYSFVNLSDSNRVKPMMIHRLVMEAFCGKSDLEVNHKDGNKNNNNIENLEYVTHSENMRHSYRILKNPPVKSWLGKRGFLHNKSHAVMIKNEKSGEILKFGSYRLADENGFSRNTIRKYNNTGMLYKGLYLISSL